MDLEKFAPIILLALTHFLGVVGSRNEAAKVSAKRDELFNNLFVEIKEEYEALKADHDKLKQDYESIESRLRVVEDDNAKLLLENARLQALVNAKPLA